MPDTDFYQSLLLTKKEAIGGVAETGRDAESTVELDQTRVGRLSRMDALQGQAMAKESGRRRMIELTRIENALKRIESGDYGFCLRCDEDIPDDRLNIDPAATLCITCASDNELK